METTLVYLPMTARVYFDQPVTWATVTQVVDGNTFYIDTNGDDWPDDLVDAVGWHAPRAFPFLLWLDAQLYPPWVPPCYGLEARDRARELLYDHLVVLERDTSDTNEWDRLLRYTYVYSGTGWLWFGGVMVREGYGYVDARPPDTRYIPQLEALEAQAKAEGAGGWGACGW